MAAQMAVKSGKTMTPAEMQSLIDRLFGCAVTEVSPSGKKIYMIINAEELKTRLN